MTITMDGKQYQLAIKRGSIDETFRIEDGPNAGDLLSGEHVRDVVGTYYDHSMAVEPDPAHYPDYLDFYAAVTAPVASHEVTLPHMGGTITYQAMVTTGGNRLMDILAHNPRWTGLVINFKALKPQREAE